MPDDGHQHGFSDWFENISNENTESRRAGDYRRSAIEFLNRHLFGCTRIPVEITRRSIIERKQRRYVRLTDQPAAIG
jgi:hypothetical protein